MQPSGKSRLAALGCSATFLLCELISRPWAEMGVCDDWSYVRSAEVLARTGHVVYNGVATAMLGWQLYLGAAFIRIFGFSFTAPRIPTLLVGCMTAFLLHRTFVRLGLNGWNATVGTLTFVLAPLFLMLSPTLMTDVPGFFAILICLYACLRALATGSDRAAILWLALAVVANCICGSSRQIAWLGVLVIVPCTLYLLRSRRGVLFAGIVFTILGDLAVLLAVHWFNRQPFTPRIEKVGLSHFDLPLAAHLVQQLIHVLAVMVLFLLPVVLAYGVQAWKLRRKVPALLTLAGYALCALALLRPAILHKLHFEPFLGDWVSPYADYQNPQLIGQLPVVVGGFLHRLTVLGSVAGLLLTGLVLLHRSAEKRAAFRAPFSWTELTILLAPLFVSYCILLLRRAEQSLFDRYLLTPVFLALFVLLLHYQQNVRPRLHPASLTGLALLAFYGIVSTHNLFALRRARVTLAQEIQAAGVPALDVDLGWEQSGWVQIVNFGYIGYADPAEAGMPDPANAIVIPGCRDVPPFIPARSHPPRFGVGFEPNACSGRADFPPVSYATWPLRSPTVLYVVKYPHP